MTIPGAMRPAPEQWLLIARRDRGQAWPSSAEMLPSAPGLTKATTGLCLAYVISRHRGNEQSLLKPTLAHAT